MNTADIVGMLDTSPEKLFYLVNPKFRFRTPKSAICPLILVSHHQSGPGYRGKLYNGKVACRENPLAEVPGPGLVMRNENW